MKKFLKIGCLSTIGIVLVIIILGYVFGNNNDSNNNSSSINKINDIEKPWNEKSDIEKEETVNNFINSKDDIFNDQRFRLRLVIVEALNNSVKYPETLEFQSIFNIKDWVDSDSGKALIASTSQFQVNDYKEGLITLYVPFRSESSVGLKIRKRLIFQFIYNGTANFYPKDVKIE